MVSTRVIFYFSIGAGHMSLFLASPRNQRRTKKKAITSGRPVISGIRKCTKNKKRLSIVEKAMEESDF